MMDAEKDDLIFLEDRLNAWLFKIRITPNMKGYAILKDIVLQLVFESWKKGNFNKLIYPPLAEKYKISVSQIERRLKTVCEICKRKSSESDLSFLFGSLNIDTLSVKQVVCSLAERLKIEYRAMQHQKGGNFSANDDFDFFIMKKQQLEKKNLQN